MLSGVDTVIVIVYFAIVLAIGLYARRRGTGTLEDYFLGGRNIPWYILGITGMTAFLDMSGTMLQTSFFYFLGVKGYWVAYRGAVALMLAFFMIFMGKWLVRSRVMTIAELISLRFGSDGAGNVARVLSAASAIIISVTMFSYFFIGTGKFFQQYVPGMHPGLVAGAIFAFMMIFTVASGFLGVVYTELFQGVLILGVIIFITVKAMAVGTPAYFAAHTPAEWHELVPRTWSVAMPPGYESLEMLGLLILFWIVLNVLQGFANPLDAMSAQKFFAARDEREGSLAAMQWIVLLGLRFLLMMAMAVLAVGLVQEVSDPEMALPAVIEHILPVGLKGLFVAGLLAALMSTVEALVNSSAAYFVRDIYHRFIRPEATDRHLVRVSYVTTVVLFVVGGVAGLFGQSLNAIWSWLMMGFITGIIPPGILKWVWWRFNAAGYTGGMLAGIAGAGLQAVVFTDPPEWVVFLFVIGCSTAGTVAGTLLGKPTDRAVLVNFYERIRPFGWWGPVRRALPAELLARTDRENRRDLWLLVPASIWQLTIFWVLVAVVVRQWTSVLVSLAVIAACSLVLYRYWYLNLQPSEGGPGSGETRPEPVPEMRRVPD